MSDVKHDDYDSPWKEVLERYFLSFFAFFAFFFPSAHADIDRARGYRFLNKEMQKVVRVPQNPALTEVNHDWCKHTSQLPARRGPETQLEHCAHHG
jgi:hypothetical protein